MPQDRGVEEQKEMKKREVIDELETILRFTKLSPRAGKYEAMERFDWFNTVGRSRLVALIERLKERRGDDSAGG